MPRSWRILSILLLCAHVTTARELSIHKIFDRRHTTTKQLRSGQGQQQRRRQQQEGDGMPQEVLLQNIQLTVRQAPQMLQISGQELFERIMAEWFLRFYETDTSGTSIGNVSATTVTFRMQEVEGDTSIITYDQAMTYIPFDANTTPETFIIRPFGNLDANAMLSTQLSEIPAWMDRAASFLIFPEILGPLPTIAPTVAPTSLAPTSLAPITAAPTTAAPITAAPTTAEPSSTSPTTMAPVTPSPTNALPTSIPTKSPTEMPVVGASNAPSVEPTTMIPSTMAPVTASPTLSPSLMPVVPAPEPVSNTLVDLELVYGNVDSINETQLKLIENVTEQWFNEFFAETRRLRRNLQMIATNVTADFNFLSKEYAQRRLTVLFEVTLEYQGRPDDALEILQQPWRERASVGKYRQLLIEELPVFFDTVEATAPPEYLQDNTSPAPAPTPEEGLSRLAITGIVVICVVIVLLIGAAWKFQQKARNRQDIPLKNNPTAYSPHVNEDEDSVLFPQANADAGGPSSRSRLGGVSLPPEKDEQSYDGKSVDTNDFDYSKVGANTLAPSSRLSSTTPSVASGHSNMFEGSDLQTQDNEDQFVIYAPAGKLGLVVDNRDDGPPVIHSIKEDSVLIDQIQVGDRLIGVDEVDVRTLSPVRVSKLISKRSTNPLRKLTLTREKAGDDTTTGGQSSYMESMSRMTGVDTDTQDEALGQGFSDDETSFVGSMSRVSGGGQSMDSSAADLNE